MRYLLDTHSALWMFAGSSDISPELQDVLTSPENEIYFSDVSAWEIVIKNSIGKLRLPSPPEEFVPDMVYRHRLESLAITLEAILHWGKLPWIHRDPFDRLLIAQANERGLIVISKDAEIRQYPVNVFWV